MSDNIVTLVLVDKDGREMRKGKLELMSGGHLLVANMERALSATNLMYTDSEAWAFGDTSGLTIRTFQPDEVIRVVGQPEGQLQERFTQFVAAVSNLLWPGGQRLT